MPYIIEITDIGGSKASITQQLIDRILNPRTNEYIEVPYTNREAIGLGTYTTTDPKTGVTTVDEDGFKAEVAAKIAAVLHADLAPFVAAAALETAKAAQAKADADAYVAAAIADAQAQVAAILQAAPPVDVGPSPVTITPPLGTTQ